MSKRVVFYLKGINRSIVITDNSDVSEDELALKINNCLSEMKVVQFETDTDILIARSSDITAVYITKNGVGVNKLTKEEKSPSKADYLQAVVPEIDFSEMKDAMKMSKQKKKIKLSNKKVGPASDNVIEDHDPQKIEEEKK